MKKLYFTYLSLLFACASFAQQAVKLNINHKLLTQNFAFNQTSTNNLGHSFQLTRLQYYMSNFIIIHDGAQTTTATGVYALVDASTVTSINLGNFAGVTNIEGIKFSVGVNTPENNQDPSLWPSTHPLSPKSPSMQWGWASGYFFIVYEGVSSPALNQTLEMSCLGNANYYSQTITTGATLVGMDKIITINADYAQGFKNITISSGLVSHGSTGVNATMSTNFRDFVFSPVATNVGINENSNSNNNLTIYPNPSTTGLFSISIDYAKTTATKVKITDITGRILQLKNLSELANNQILIENKGIYFVSLLNENTTLATEKVVVY